MFWSGRKKLEFLCRPEDEGVIARPVPAKTSLPAWFKKLPPVDKAVLGPNGNGQTIKRCMPFLDAMATGWILPLAATIRLQVEDGGRVVHWGTDFDRTMVSEHQPYQIKGHPLEPRPPIKIHNYWTIRTPPGWSCLFVPPLNRAHPALEVIAGLVDTDRYASLIHFPCIVTGPDGHYTFEKGMPLVQVIPFERRSTSIEAEVRAESQTEADERERIRRSTMASDGWYRRFARQPRD